MTIPLPVPEPQACLFDALPLTEPRRRRRPPRPAAVGAASTPAPVMARAPAPPEAPAVAPPPAPPLVVPVPEPSPASPPVAAMARAGFNGHALSNPELDDLVRTLEAPSLAFLLTRTVREVKRRLAPASPCFETDEPDEAGAPSEANPALVRALRIAASELSEEE